MDNAPLADAADALQQAWILPLQVVDLTPESSAPHLAVVGDDGGLYRASPRWSYAVVARPPGREQAEILALSKDAGRALVSQAAELQTCWN